MKHLSPLATTFSLPFHCGFGKSQSAALKMWRMKEVRRMKVRTKAHTEVRMKVHMTQTKLPGQSYSLNTFLPPPNALDPSLLPSLPPAQGGGG